MTLKIVLFMLVAAMFVIGCAVKALDQVEVIPAAPPPVELTVSFAEVAERIRPRADEEVWRGIPWVTSLWEARKQAAKEDKPIFVWSMDGHPLCHS